MIEYIVIFAIVAVTAFFTGRYLWREAKTGRCANCDCAARKDASSGDSSDRFSV
jgi:hypothetical protein